MKVTARYASAISHPVPREGRRAQPHRRSAGAAPVTLAAVVTAGLMLTPLAASASPGEPAPTAATGDPRTDLRTAMDAVVATGVPGMIVRIQDADRPPRRHAVGTDDLASGEALRPNARFRIGSITKTFVATIVLQLVDEGRLRLDDPVGRYLPDLLANGDQITVRQILNHTSGLPDYTLNPKLFAGIVQNRIWRPRELIALASSQPQLFPSGSAHAYSNTNYIVAGLLIEAVARHPLVRELDRRIFRPLHLDDTSFPTADEPLTGYYAHGYFSTEAIPTADGQPLDVTGYNPSHAWAAGAIVSSADDLSTFYRVLMTGRLLSPSTLAQMMTTVPEDPSDPTDTFSYGLGLERVQDACGANWGHSGSIYGYQDLAYWNERTGRTVVVATTMSPAPAAAEARVAKAAELALCGSADPGRHRRLADSEQPHHARTP